MFPSVQELDIASQGETVEEATANLKEAIELFFEHASGKEIGERKFELAPFYP
ncbi:MAG: hypothetical protein WD824_20030 [Cyclobacteriaceae bacterium]